MLLRNRRWPRVLTWLGKISYSVYLVHLPILWLTDWAVRKYFYVPDTGWRSYEPKVAMLALVFVIAPLSHRFLELPGQRLGKRVQTMLDRRFPQPKPETAVAEPAVAETAGTPAGPAPQH